MTFHVDAIFEHGVLKPLGPLDLNDREVVSLAIEKVSPGQQSSQDGATLFDLLDKAGLVGCIQDGPADLSTNPKYFEDFGKSAS